MIPTSIDGTDITGATIDGQDVQEITVDGQTVFSAGPNLPVAYSNLVAWYPFDSATYGGSNADDVTAILGGSRDDTAYDGTVSGATYNSNGGVTDIQAGANSGYYDLDGGDKITTNTALHDRPDNGQNITMCAWIKGGFANNEYYTMFGGGSFFGSTGLHLKRSGTSGGGACFNAYINGDINEHQSFIVPDTSWHHWAGTWDGTNGKIYFDGIDETTSVADSPRNKNAVNTVIGKDGNQITFNDTDFDIDDARIYDKELTASEINQIYQNTEP
jgi:hypothetical protein